MPRLQCRGGAELGCVVVAGIDVPPAASVDVPPPPADDQPAVHYTGAGLSTCTGAGSTSARRRRLRQAHFGQWARHSPPLLMVFPKCKL
jgi:hypothetical protein